MPQGRKTSRSPALVRRRVPRESVSQSMDDTDRDDSVNYPPTAHRAYRRRSSVTHPSATSPTPSQRISKTTKTARRSCGGRCIRLIIQLSGLIWVLIWAVFLLKGRTLTLKASEILGPDPLGLAHLDHLLHMPENGGDPMNHTLAIRDDLASACAGLSTVMYWSRPALSRLRNGCNAARALARHAGSDNRAVEHGTSSAALAVSVLQRHLTWKIDDHELDRTRIIGDIGCLLYPPNFRYTLSVSLLRVLHEHSEWLLVPIQNTRLRAARAVLPVSAVWTVKRDVDLLLPRLEEVRVKESKRADKM